MAKKTVRRYSTPEPMSVAEEPVNCPMPEPACPMPVNLSAVPMASLGTPTISGAKTAETGAKVALTAACDPKTNGAVLTWEGVGIDIFGADTGGLTGDQDHDETINLTFAKAGSYTVKAGYSDVAADNSPQYSAGHTIVVTAPAPEPPADPDAGFGNGRLATEAGSMEALFAQKYRPISVKPVAGDGASFDVTRVADTDQPDPNEGELDWMLKWLSFHFTGQITDARGAGYFRLTLDSKDARVVPGGGAKPSKVVTA